MKYVSAIFLAAIAFFILDCARFMWPSRLDHPDGWLAVVMLPIMLGVVGIMVLFAALAVAIQGIA